MKFTKAELESMTNKEINYITFCDCSNKCCSNGYECNQIRADECRKHLIKYAES